MAASSTSTPGCPFSINSRRSVEAALPSSATLAFMVCWIEKGLVDLVKSVDSLGIDASAYPLTSRSSIIYSFAAALVPRSRRYTM